MKLTSREGGNSGCGDNSGFHVAHIGNSIQYYNDCPRLLERMLRASVSRRQCVVGGDGDPEADNANLVHQGSCLRGGATLPSLWLEGNGMQRKFSSRPESKVSGEDRYDIGAPTVGHQAGENRRYWDFVVMNDHTQSAVRDEAKQQSKDALETHYLPTIVAGMKESATANSTITTTVVFVQTAAYKSPVKNSSDLGSFDDFTDSLIRGYDEYIELRSQQIVLKATVAPLGEAYRTIRQDNFEMWSNLLYANDDFHPSPHGTMLEACLLYFIVSGGRKFELFDGNEAEFSATYWWETARYMQPRNGTNGEPQDPLPLPTKEEAVYLNDVAHRIFLERQQAERDQEQGREQAS
eukprot:jgi/Psemu1/189339/e_gw1.87.79.1